nr:MAG TPA: hypothetical protein [Caudoviricetes sp.]
MLLAQNAIMILLLLSILYGSILSVYRLYFSNKYKEKLKEFLDRHLVDDDVSVTAKNNHINHS